MERIDYSFMQAVDEAFDIKPKIIELGARVIGYQKALSARNIFNKNKIWLKLLNLISQPTKEVKRITGLADCVNCFYFKVTVSYILLFKYDLITKVT